jgi:hypothetical protein
MGLWGIQVQSVETGRHLACGVSIRCSGVRRKSMQLGTVFLSCAPLLAFLFTSSSSSTHAAVQEHYKRMSLCAILAAPSESYLQDVAIDADLVSARPHGVVLVDQQCPGEGLLLDFLSTDSDRSVRDLDKAIRNGELSSNGSLSLESAGRFCGKIRRDHATKRLVLSLHLVQNLQPKNPSTIHP